MKVEPIPGERTRFFVQSESRPDVQHVVDLDYEGTVVCGCEQMQAKKESSCKHVAAVAQHLLKQLDDMPSTGMPKNDPMRALARELHGKWNFITEPKKDETT